MTKNVLGTLAALQKHDGFSFFFLFFNPISCQRHILPQPLSFARMTQQIPKSETFPGRERATAAETRTVGERGHRSVTPPPTYEKSLTFLHPLVI